MARSEDLEILIWDKRKRKTKHIKTLDRKIQSFFLHGAVTQLVECFTEDEMVTSSNLVGTTFTDI